MNLQRNFYIGLTALIAHSALFVGLSSASAADKETNFYQRCASCHLKNGAGVIGLYPPLAGHIDAFLDSTDGRAYLLQVTLYGLQGRVKVNGTTYFGAMPNVVAGLDAQNIQALMGELVQKFGTKKQQAKGSLFPIAEIKRAMQQPKSTRAEMKVLRAQVFGK